MLGVLGLHKLLTERSIGIALYYWLKPGGRVIHDALSLLSQLFGFLLRHLDRCTIKVHENARFIVAQHTQSFADRFSMAHASRSLLVCSEVILRLGPCEVALSETFLSATVLV